MKGTSLLRSWSIGGMWILGLAALALASLVVWQGGGEIAARRPAGEPRLVSIVPLPAAAGEMCEWVPASASTAVTFQRAQTAGGAAADSAARPAMDADRAPVRVIRDTFPTYSAVAVDLNTNEVFLQDENLFGVKVFNRLDNTPPGANFTEPKRVLGGLETKLEFNCALYVDPLSGDLYSVNNDTVDTMTVFPRNAQGNIKPMRQLETPHRTYGIAVDEERQELYMTVEHPPAVVVYRKMAQGEEKPIRILEGERTQLEDAHGIAIDPKNKLLFVSNHGATSRAEPDDSVLAIKRRIPGSGKFDPPSITVYALDARGNTAPLRIIEGPRTQLNWPAAMAIDTERGELYVANDVEDSIVVFRTTDTGNTAPSRVIQGPRTGLKNPTGIFVDPKNRELWASNMGNHSATAYSLDANGNAAPRRTIRSAPPEKLALAIGNPGAVAYDSKREEILVPN